MRRHVLLFLFLLPLAALMRAQAPPQQEQEPKLILFVAIDQFRYDYLPRFRNEYAGGIKTLLEHGAVFSNAHLEHYPTVTAVGHSTMMSGATPAVSGIIGNDWFDRESGKQVTSVSDPAAALLGAPGEASSPRRLLVSTVGDELKRSGSPDSKVFGVSMKDRSAILPAGRMADGAFWFDDDTGSFVSSDYYFAQPPPWAQAFNAAAHPNEYAGKTWSTGRVIPTELGAKLNSAVYGSSYGNDLLEAFAEVLIREEQLGQRGVTDVLTVSFSSNDAVGHTYGPDSPEAHAVSLAVDGTLGRLFAAVDTAIGMDNVLVVLTADHSVSPMPEVLAEQRLPGGRLQGNFFALAEEALTAKYGPGKWIEATAGSSPYFNYALMNQQGIDRVEAENLVAEAMRKHPQVARVYTRHEILAGRAIYDKIDERVLRSFNAQRSGDLEIVLNPYWIRGASGTTHGSPYNYDSHIPLIFMGPGIKPGRYYKAAALNDAAPTIAALLDIEMPSGSLGRILDEIID